MLFAKTNHDPSPGSLMLGPTFQKIVTAGPAARRIRCLKLTVISRCLTPRGKSRELTALGQHRQMRPTLVATTGSPRLGMRMSTIMAVTVTAHPVPLIVHMTFFFSLDSNMCPSTTDCVLLHQSKCHQSLGQTSAFSTLVGRTDLFLVLCGLELDVSSRGLDIASYSASYPTGVQEKLVPAGPVLAQFRPCYTPVLRRTAQRGGSFDSSALFFQGLT
ncbi:hypothetical protein PoB_005109000 [Plakobranchus ocellatus]|uniref:Uncharacterized protein n=1 Tax=Plakobranchus ocellatus TaxID=259542 RepID=A0AAV4BZL5_9GAST|nr:hypothetical protein PoB_005109000 [Plakobranchus ocellatus]